MGYITSYTLFFFIEDIVLLPPRSFLISIKDSCLHCFYIIAILRKLSYYFEESFSCRGSSVLLPFVGIFCAWITLFCYPLRIMILQSNCEPILENNNLTIIIHNLWIIRLANSLLINLNYYFRSIFMIYIQFQHIIFCFILR